VGPRITLTRFERHVLTTVSEHHCATGAAEALNLSLAELATTLIAIRAHLGVSSTAAALTHLLE
jgi:hypothetical protein